MVQRSLQSLQNDLAAGLLIAFQLVYNLGNLLCCVNISRTAACDDAFLNSCLRSCQSILHTKFRFLHLSLSSSAYADNSNAACQFRQSLLKFLSVKVRGGLLDLGSDLAYSCRDLVLVAAAVHDDGVLLLNLYGFRAAKLIHGYFLQIQAKLIGDYLSACQDGDIL